MYGSIYELPSQVTSSLDDVDAKVWMDTYNNLKPISKSEIKKAKRAAWHACKNLPSSFSFKIKASMDMIDKDREIIDLDSIKKHLDSYIDYGGNVQWEHGDYNVGTVWDWEPIKKDGVDGVEVWGNLFGGDHVYDRMRKSFIDGKNSMSVAGEADKGKYQCDEKGCYVRKGVKQLLEISLCAVPANKGCTLSWYNKDAKLTKSAKEDINLKVDEYIIHKSYYECPILSLQKSLKDIGYKDAHATYAGVKIKMSNSEFAKAYPYMEKHNLHAIRLGDSVYLNDKNYLIEKSYKLGLDCGFINPDGTLLPNITKSQFSDLVERDVLEEENGVFRIKRPI